MLLYLSSAIDHRQPGGPSLSHLVQLWLQAHPQPNLVVFHPDRAWTAQPGPDLDQATARAVLTVDLRALELAEAVLLQYQPGVESWGVPQELKLAWDRRLPIFVVVSAAGLTSARKLLAQSLVVWGQIDLSHVYLTVAEALAAVVAWQRPPAYQRKAE